MKKEGSGKGVAIIGFILGLLSLIFCWVPVLNMILSIIAIIICGIGLKKSESNKGLVIAGLAMSIIGLIIGIIVSIITLAVVSIVNNSNLNNSDVWSKTSNYTLDECYVVCDEYPTQAQTDTCSASCAMIGKEGSQLDAYTNSVKNITESLD